MEWKMMRKYGTNRSLWLALALGLGTADAAVAQYQMDLPDAFPVIDYSLAVHNSIGNSIVRDAIQRSNQESLSAPAQRSSNGLGTSTGSADRIDATQFDYRPSAAVGVRVRKTLVASVPAAQRAEVQRALSDDAILREFDRVIGNFGYSVDNLADVMTSYYVMMWEIVNDQEVSRNIIRAVHAQMLQGLAGNAEAVALSDKDKQETAETMAYMAAIAGGAANQLKQNGDTRSLTALRESVYQAVLKQGIDLRAIKLGSNGFASR
ncbi:MAG: DUF6683 family protein [Thermodesulfobacteriota bacterium]|nr:DUF6683 family protein [Thermodesulfobacteriota bacterium]